MIDLSLLIKDRTDGEKINPNSNDSFEKEFSCLINKEKKKLLKIPLSINLKTLGNSKFIDKNKISLEKFNKPVNLVKINEYSVRVKELTKDTSINQKDILNFENNYNLPSTNPDNSTISCIDNLEDLVYDVNSDFTLHKLIFAKDTNGVSNLLLKFSRYIEFLDKVINLVDPRGNTPVMLCVILRSKDRSQEYLEILALLFNYSANPKIRDDHKWTPLEMATSLEDRECVNLIYDYLLKRRAEKIKRNKERLCQFLGAIPDFYLDMNWEVNIPLVGFLCPKDTCKIWKFKNNVRMDYTFLQIRNLKTVRRPTGFIFRENKKNRENEVFKLDLRSCNYFNPFEPLEEDEKMLIVNDIMNSNRFDGEFKLKNCLLNESKTYFSGKCVYDMIDGKKCKKYDVSITAFLNLHNKQKFEYENLDKQTYFNLNYKIVKKNTLIMDETKLKTNIVDGLKVKNYKMREQILNMGNNKDKKLTANIWIAEYYPIPSSHLIAIFDSLSGANEYTKKIKEFLNDNEVKNILDKNGFPVKIIIPINFLTDFTVTFTNFKKISNLVDPYIEKKFDIPENLQRITRKKAQDLAKDKKKRLGYANIQG